MRKPVIVTSLSAMAVFSVGVMPLGSQSPSLVAIKPSTVTNRGTAPGVSFPEHQRASGQFFSPKPREVGSPIIAHDSLRSNRGSVAATNWMQRGAPRTVDGGPRGPP
jgi:hypothetical protein